MTIEERLARLEVQNSRLKWGLSVTATIFAVVCVMGAAGPSRDDESSVVSSSDLIKTKRLEVGELVVVNAAGQVVARISDGGGGTGVLVLADHSVEDDEFQYCRILPSWLRFHYHKGDGDHDVIADLLANRHGADLSLGDGKGKSLDHANMVVGQLAKDPALLDKVRRIGPPVHSKNASKPLPKDQSTTAPSNNAVNPSGGLGEF